MRIIIPYSLFNRTIKESCQNRQIELARNKIFKLRSDKTNENWKPNYLSDSTTINTVRFFDDNSFESDCWRPLTVNFVRFCVFINRYPSTPPPSAPGLSFRVGEEVARRIVFEWRQGDLYTATVFNFHRLKPICKCMSHTINGNACPWVNGRLDDKFTKVWIRFRVCLTFGILMFGKIISPLSWCFFINWNRLKFALKLISQLTRTHRWEYRRVYA